MHGLNADEGAVLSAAGPRRASSAHSMGWRDAVALAANGVLRRFGRAVLTVLAVTLAAALLVALLAISTTARDRVLSQLSKGGPLAGIRVAAAYPDPSQIDVDNARPGPPRPLDATTLQRIARLPDVATVLPVVTDRELVIPPVPPYRDGSIPTPGPVGPSSTPSSAPSPLPRAFVPPFLDTVVGVDIRRITDLPVTLLAGRFPAPSATNEVAVTQGYLQRVGLDPKAPEPVLGTEVELGAPRSFSVLGEQPVRARWVRAVIVGVVAQEAADGDIVQPLRQAQISHDWTAGGGGFDRLNEANTPYSGLFVIARGLDKVGAVRERITAVGFATSAPENLIASVTRYLRVVEIVLSAIGLIALVIAALGIASALMAAVRERRREIGVLKAIGARDRDILRMFLIEASVIGLIGGSVGTLCGWLVARAVGAVVNGYLTAQGLAGVSVGLPWFVLIGGVVGSTLLALTAGTIPSLRAARLPAREAVEAL